MSREELTEKVNELLENPQFVEALTETKSREDMARVLGEFGVKVTAEELDDILASVPASGELSEEDLEAVSGGCSYWIIVLAILLGISIARLIQLLRHKTVNQIKRQYGR